MARSGEPSTPRPRGPLSDAELRRLRTLHGKGMGCNEIARKMNRSAAAISAAAKKLELSFAREQTAAATTARQVDLAAARAQLAADLMEDAQRFRERAWSKYKVVVGGGEGAEIVELPLPPLGDARSAYQAIGVCIDKTKVLVDADKDTGEHAARSMLGDLARALDVAAGQLPPTDTTG